MAIFRFGTSFDPFVGLRSLQRELERLSLPWAGEARRVGCGNYPPVNVYESPGEIVVQCEAPGVSAEDFDISITGETLVIKGLKRPPADEEKVRFVRRERGSGEFTRTIMLPDEVEAEKIQAKLSDGVMTIRLPKSATARPRKIEVKTS
jgi:HSP20 family protein